MGIVFLVGARGSGKSTVGRILADRLGCAFVDTDLELALHFGRSVAEMIGAEGWPGFRAREGAVLRRVVRGAGSGPAVVATGGGMVLFSANRSYMRRSGLVVWLDAPAEVLGARVRSDGGATLRPSLTGGDPDAEMARVLAWRAPLYGDAAHYRVDAAGPGHAVACAIQALLAENGDVPFDKNLPAAYA